MTFLQEPVPSDAGRGGAMPRSTTSLALQVRSSTADGALRPGTTA
jgi:hypothetical protein